VRVFSHPLRLDAAGRFATIEQDDDDEAAQVAQVILSTVAGERPLAPMLGLPDPTGVGVDEAGIRAAVVLGEPELRVVGADIVRGPDGLQSADVIVAWADDEEGS